MEQYLKLLLEQIRCKRVHPYIKEEIQAHIEDQIEDNIQLGMTMEEAEKAAVPSKWELHWIGFTDPRRLGD